MAALIEAPFKILRPPRLHLVLPNLPRPSPMMVFALIFLSYFMVVSGVVYDLITEPPSIGTERDEKTGALKPVVFLKYRVNGQYIMEGLSAGVVFAIGAFGVIGLDKIETVNIAPKSRFYRALIASGAIAVAYLIAVSFLRIKVPGYGF
jgi:hypothetical protein